MMKKTKFILTIFMMFVALNFIQAQTSQDTSQYVTGSNTEKLIDKYSQKFEGAIQAMAEKLEQPASHVYSVLVKQQKMQAISALIIIGIFLFFSIGLWLVSYITYKIDYDEDTVTGWKIFAGIVSVIALVVIAFLISSIITGFFNPEYGAIKDITDFIK